MRNKIVPPKFLLSPPKTCNGVSPLPVVMLTRTSLIPNRSCIIGIVRIAHGLLAQGAYLLRGHDGRQSSRHPKAASPYLPP